MLTSANVPRRRKKATKLSIDRDLLHRARRLELDLSQTVEAALTEAIRRHERAQWLEKNRAALDAYNEHVDKQGGIQRRLARLLTPQQMVTRLE